MQILRFNYYLYREQINLKHMSLIEKTEPRAVVGITKEEHDAIFSFLQGAIYSWCKNRADEWFSIRELLGGDNYFWDGTPLIALYTKHKEQLGKEWDQAIEGADKDSRWILKEVIFKDKRIFESKKDDTIRIYKWTGETES